MFTLQTHSFAMSATAYDPTDLSAPSPKDEESPPNAAAAPTGSSAELYFERQWLMRCGAHALNNVLGRPAFTSADLDAIAISLGGTFSLQHRWPLLGNHDANVVLCALDQCGLDAAWWDARRTDGELSAALAAHDVVGTSTRERTHALSLAAQSCCLGCYNQP